MIVFPARQRHERHPTVFCERDGHQRVGIMPCVTPHRSDPRAQFSRRRDADTMLDYGGAVRGDRKRAVVPPVNNTGVDRFVNGDLEFSGDLFLRKLVTPPELSRQRPVHLPFHVVDRRSAPSRCDRQHLVGQPGIVGLRAWRFWPPFNVPAP